RPCPFHNHQPDPFREARQKDGILINDFHGDVMPILLRHGDVRNAARDWETFSSDAPFKIPIPTEESVRTVRQLPLEIDPPDQLDYRAIMEPYFNRAKLPEVIAQVEALMEAHVHDALSRDSIEIVREFAIPLQSRGLAILLNTPLSEAETWIGWGVHVFREGDGTSKGAAMEAYASSLLERGAANPSDDFFSALTRATFHGRKLTREEMLGFCSIVFAGGRDTIINSISGVIGHLAKNRSDLEFLQADPKRVIGASEEFFRVLSPSTHLTRKCTRKVSLHGVEVQPGEFVSLNFAAANYDPEVFEDPESVRLDRRPNPHVAFGFGTHLCLGAAHARLMVRTLLKSLCQHVARIEVIDAKDRLETETTYQRRLAYETLRVRMIPYDGSHASHS
ncbi:MAG: cytochrome P450, partial [Opitutaceae bacterium]|nr:cytochrome P450 [Opitutaceae bacterium]